MATQVKLSDDLVEDAKRIATAEHRSVPKQIEYYYQLARTAEQNPDLSIALVNELIRSKIEPPNDNYKIGN